MKQLDILSKKALQNMFEVLLDDLNSGRNPNDAGWRLSEEFSINSATKEILMRVRLIQENSKGQVRLNFENYSVRARLKENFELEIKELEYLMNIREDETKLEKAFTIINRVVKLLLKTPENWKFVIMMGCWKMLESSGMPAMIDDVLKEGFSPENWTIKAIRSSPTLALEIVQNYGEIIKPEDCGCFLKEIPIEGISFYTSYTPPNEHDVEKIKKILRWQEVKEVLDECDVKALALFWFLFFALEYINLFPVSNEYILKLYEKIWNVVEKLLNRNQQELVSNLERKTELLAEKGITWISDILRIPEVI